MKNATQLLRKVAMIAMLCFTFTSCNETVSTTSQEGEKPQVLAPSQIVEINQAKSMYENYTNRRVPLIQHYEDSINRGKMKIQDGDSKPFDVSRYVYYDYQTIKQYMDYIEQEASAAGVEISTLRLYLSNYPDKEFFPSSKDSILHPRQNSIMLSPTIKKGKREHLFYIAQGVKGKEAVLLNDEFGTPKGMGLLESKNNTSIASIVPDFFKSNAKPIYASNSLTLNKGHGIPPPYPQN